MRHRIESELDAIRGLQREIELRYEIIGVAIHTARAMGGRSQREFAKAAGIDHAHLSRVERGEKRPSEDVLERIMAADDAASNTIAGAASSPERDDPQPLRGRP